MQCRSRMMWAIALLVEGAAACASSGAPPVVVAPDRSPDSALGPGDTFEVNVYGEKELSGKYRVGEDGTINFPFVGHIPAAGKGPAAIADAIQTALADKHILRDPHVSVFLLEQTSKQVSVMGAVAKPGAYPLASGMTIVQALSIAGGLSALASGDNTIVTRNVRGQLQRFKVQVESITEGHVADFRLQDGDIVFVPERVF